MSSLSSVHLRMLGSARCQRAVADSLPATRLEFVPGKIKSSTCGRSDVLGRLPSTAGWQPALPEGLQ